MKDLSRLLELLNTPASKQQVHCNCNLLTGEHLRVHENLWKHVCHLVGKNRTTCTFFTCSVASENVHFKQPHRNLLVNERGPYLSPLTGSMSMLPKK